MTAVYGIARFSALPTDDVLGKLLRTECTVCHHDDIRGGVCLECVAMNMTADALYHVLKVMCISFHGYVGIPYHQIISLLSAGHRRYRYRDCANTVRGVVC